VVEFSPRPEVVRELDAPRGSGPQSEPSRRGEILSTAPESLSGSLDLSGPRSLVVPSGRLPAEVSATQAESLAGGRAKLSRPEPGAAALVPEPGGRLSVPGVEEVLAAMPAGRREAAPAVRQEGSPRGYLDSGALEWGGRERKVLKAARPEFPEVLLQEGQEADVEATFKVAPNGQVTLVEISRSSGYSAVDRAVERALLNTLFEPSATDDEDTGRARFRFRLERVN
jgi:TonB family protein